MKACRLQEDQQVGEDRLAELISFLQKIAAVSSGLLSILSALVAVILGYYFGYRPALAEPALSAGPREETRIADAAKELRRQEWANRWNRWISGTLTVGQYLAGATLASTFIQKTMSEYWVGVLGLIVLFSQVIQQRFRPDLRAIGAKERATILRRLIRDAEDQLYAHETQQADALSLYAIRTMVSRKLADVEQLESEELTLQMRAQREAPEGQQHI
jgi:hypothetical protein